MGETASRPRSMAADTPLYSLVGHLEQAIDYVTSQLFDKPAEFYTLDKLRRAAGVDRRLTPHATGQVRRFASAACCRCKATHYL